MSSRIASAVQNPRNSDEPWLEVAKLVLSPSRGKLSDAAERKGAINTRNGYSA